MLPDTPAATRLQISNLGCMRGGKVLFRKLSFEVPRGTILTLRGSNGCGKSTLLRTLAGLLPMRAGELRWDGHAVQPCSAAYQQHIAFLSHHAAMNNALTGLENLQYLLQLAGVPVNAERMREVLEQLGIQRAAHLAFSKCSQGQRRRLALARVLLSNKPLWLLDEPDNALDEQGLQWLHSALTDHAAAGGMAIVATHRGLNLQASPVLDLSSDWVQRAGEQVAA